MVGIVDYQVGNLASIQNALLYLGVRSEIQSDPYKISHYSHLILPGVGAFGDAMLYLKKSGMHEAVLEYVKKGRAILGICLGMQLLFEKSYEFGEYDGLGLISGSIVPFSREKLAKEEKIPHMGWNRVELLKDSPLTKNLKSGFYLYFVHSFCAAFNGQKEAVGKSVYGLEFVSILQSQNIFGIQPHPEKSHNMGLMLLRNFINYC